LFRIHFVYFGFYIILYIGDMLKEEFYELESLISRVGPKQTQRRVRGAEKRRTKKSIPAGHNSYLDEIERLANEDELKDRTQCNWCQRPLWTWVVVIGLCIGGLGGFVYNGGARTYFLETNVAPIRTSLDQEPYNDLHDPPSHVPDESDFDEEVKEGYEEEEEEKVKKTNLLLTSYFVHQRNPLGQRQMDYNKTLIMDFVDNVAKFVKDTQIVMLIDWKFDVGEEVPITFVKVDFRMVPYSINDYRFFLYYEYVRNSKDKGYKYVLMTDFKDLKFGRDPFQFFHEHQKKKIFVGQETESKRNLIRWITKKAANCYKDDLDNIGYEKAMDVLDVLQTKKDTYFYANPGIFGGERYAVLKVLTEMVTMFRTIPPKPAEQKHPCNANYMVFLTVIYGYHQKKTVFTGPPLHSPWQSYLPVSEDFVMFHK